VEQAIEKMLSKDGLTFIGAALASRKLMSKELCFIIEHIVLVGCAFTVIIVMSCQAYHRLRKYHTHIMKGEDYIEEIATFTQTKAREMQKAHRRAHQINHLLSLVYFFLWGTVKVLTVPILTHVYVIIDCPLAENGERHLSIKPDVICWQGRHLYWGGISVAVAAGYIFCVLPFTFVGANIRVFSESKSMEELARNSAITACSVHLAYFTPIGLNWSLNQLTEFVVKTTLPAVAILQNQHHILRCSMITAVFAVETLVAVLWPASGEAKASFLYAALKFSLLYVSMCTLYGGYHADRLEAAPGLLSAIVVGLVLIFIVTLVRLLLPNEKKQCCGVKVDPGDGSNRIPLVSYEGFGTTPDDRV
jgi:hypothetical protein